MSHRAFAVAHGAHPADVARVRDFANEAGLRVTKVDLLSRTVVLNGTTRRIASAFAGRGGLNARRSIPRVLRPMVQSVCGPDTGQAVRPHFQAAAPFPTGTPPDLAHYRVTQVARLYRFPARCDGRGQVIALLELGGGFRRADLLAYFRRLGLPLPKVSVVSVNGARNRPIGGLLTADTEVCLDVEVAGAAAPGARLVVYFAPNTHTGFVAGVKAAVYDRRRRPTILSISWGGAEPTWNRHDMRTLDEVFQDAAALGITVCASSGDQGPSDGLEHRRAVDYPASSPHVLACGGTRLLVHGAERRETPWNDSEDGWGESGTGRSVVFGRPSYQTRLVRAASGRSVPDVAGNADPETGYLIRVNGHWIRTAGTSAVAPLWAGLLARCAQALGRRIGSVHGILYAPDAREALRGVPRPASRHSRRRWQPFTGLGVPDGARLLTALRSALGTIEEAS